MDIPSRIGSGCPSGRWGRVVAVVKICGVRRLVDARAAVAAGADIIGFTFWPGTKRYIAPEEAAR